MVFNPFADGDPTSAPPFTDPDLLATLGEHTVEVPRGEPRRLVAELARSLATREPVEERDTRLAAAGAALSDSVHAEAQAYLAALPVLAREERVQAPLAELEPMLAALGEDDRRAYASHLARAAAPAIGVDLEVMKDEGYRFVATYIKEGSENVDIVGRAGSWLTRRMTVVNDAPRLAMRRFLALLAEEIEVDLPVVSGLIDAALAQPVPEAPEDDPLFVSLARGLVEEALAERGPPW